MVCLGSLARPSTKHEQEYSDEAGRPGEKGTGPATPELHGLVVGLPTKIRLLTPQIKRKDASMAKTTPNLILTYKNFSPTPGSKI